MTEILEYTLVVLVSALFVGGSVVTYGRFSAFMAGLQIKSDATVLARLAGEAASHGSAAAVISTPESLVTCNGTSLEMTSGGAAVAQTVPGACDFAVRLAAGEHTITFDYSASTLSMEAT